MYFVIFVAVFLLVASIIYRLFSLSNQPDFRLMPPVSQAQLSIMVKTLAQNSQKTVALGKGLSYTLIKKYTRMAFRAIRHTSSDCFEFQGRLYQNFYTIEQAVASLKHNLKSTHFLPHIDDLPRIYHLCSLIVKSNQGIINEDILTSLIDDYNSITPLTHHEIQAIPLVLRYCLCEFLTIYCSKSKVISNNKKCAIIDTTKKRLDLNRLNKGSYIYYFSEYALGDLATSFNSLCEKNDISILQKTQAFIQQISEYLASVEAGLNSLSILDATLTDEFLLKINPLNQLLLGENVVYKQCTLPTKNVYLFYIAKRAKKAKMGELYYLRTIIQKATSDNQDIATKILPKAGKVWQMRLYILAIIIFSGVLCWLPTLFFGLIALPLSILLFPSAVAITLSIVNELNSKIAFRRFLPRIKIEENSPAPTLITFCGLVSNKADIDELIFNMQTIRYANPNKIFKYSLLLDLNKSKQNNTDQELLDYISQRFLQLNEDRYNIFVRKRKKVQGQNIYQGWEKKRGALLQLNDYLLQQDSDENDDKNDNFSLILGKKPKVDYVITLDSDTMLNCALELVEIITHPYNKNKCVISINAKTNPYSVSTLFSRFSQQDLGLDGYSSLNSNINYDLFDRGNYTGKGIYRLKEFQQSLKDFFPDNRVLSHDFIEGATVGCGVAEYMLESCPSSFSQSMSRSIRWIRGDWQLLPYLFKRVKNRQCVKCVNPITPIDKWHIFCNMLLSLLPTFAFFSVIYTAFFPFKLIGLGISLSFYIVCLLNAVRQIALTRKIRLDILNILFFVAGLPVFAFYNLAAIAITLLRLITKTKLLEWNIFKNSSQKINPIYSVVCGLGLLALGYINHFAFYILSAMFLAFPLIIMLTNLKLRQPKPKNHSMLQDLAQKTWQYFEHCYTDKLITDNYQQHLKLGSANRTSPTNLGFELLSVFCAYKLNYLNKEQAHQRLENLIKKIENQKKWKGNLYNWIDLDSNVLYPKYVSTVDNGNLLACLTVILSIAQDNLKKRIQNLITNMDLSALYDDKRGLMYIGFNHSQGVFEGHYDLLASEAMLTYLMAISYNKIPKNAFYNLNRVSIKANNKTTLASWGGGLFEYLMNCIFLQYPRFSMLNKSAHACIHTHIKDNQPFWGVSESQYNQTDNLGNYQYSSFGNKKIALSTQASSHVKAPYSSVLALSFKPKQVIKNLAKIQKIGATGQFGLYESVDNNTIIKTFMTHHQGMILASLTNYLCSNAIIKAMEQLPQINASKLLLTQSSFNYCIKKPKNRKLKPNLAIQEACNTTPTYPQRQNLLTNGSYFLTTSNCGLSTSNYANLCVSRNDGFKKGLRIFLNNYDILNSGKINVQFYQYKTVYQADYDGISTSITAMVLTNFDGEMRHIELKNLTNQTKQIQIKTYFEPALAKKADDLSHKIFSSFKIRTFVKENVLFAHRTNSKPLYLGHFLSQQCDYESNRHNLKFGKELPSFGSPIYPALSATKLVTLAPMQKLCLDAFIVLANDTQGVLNAHKILTSNNYYVQNLSASFSYSLHLGLNRKTADLASVLMEASFVDLPPLQPAPTIVYEHKQGVQHLKQALTQLSRLSKFFTFNTVVCYTETDSYFKKIFTSLSPLSKQIQNLYFYNYATEQGKIDLIKKNAIIFSNPITFTPIKQSKPTTTPYKNATITPPSLDLHLDNCGFLPDSSFMIMPNCNVKRPWCNVIANGLIGSVISHSGAGFTYLKNSHMFKISEHSNDPIDDNISEGIILSENAIEWSATQKPFKAKCDYYVRHGLGYTEFVCNYNGAITKQTQFCWADSKYYILQVQNKTNQHRQITATYFINLILGEHRHTSTGFVQINSFDDYIEAKNTQNGQAIRFYCSNTLLNTTKNNPSPLPNTLIPPCLTMSSVLNLAPNSTSQITFKLCQDESLEPLNTQAQNALINAKQYFGSLSKLKVNSDDKRLNHLLNWLPYQVLCSRFNARAGFYQAGGAIGFRDQLQDCLTMLFIDPQRVRSHILNCASHQFIEGDVQHWWHPPYNGVRTKINDDLLYLPLLTAEYIAFTADTSILSVSVPYLKGRLLQKNEKDAYFSPSPDISEPLFNHCIKAIQYNKQNQDGLVLMQGGDWNDALDNVGLKGKGVSVFTTIFLYYVINRFLPFVNEEQLKNQLIAKAQSLKNAVNNCYDGEWFLRLITDDGLVLGSKKSPECKIDILCQSWVGLSNISDTQKTKTALKSVAEHLIDYQNGIIKLLDPPFKNIDAGYISHYPEGIRENGGQYTHASVWYIMALLKDNQTEFAFSLLSMLNPINQRLNNQKYFAEPYVLCGDVYSAEYAGVSGWSWYTGSASWYYKCVVENILGIIKRGNTLYFCPNLPNKLQQITLNYQTERGNLTIIIKNSPKNSPFTLYINKIKYNTLQINLNQSNFPKTVLLIKE